MIINGQQITDIAVVGLGLTGQSCVRFLQQQGLAATLYDTRESLDTSSISQLAPDSKIVLGELEQSLLSTHQILLVSPGISTSQTAIAAAKHQGVLIWGDIELFAHFVQVPVIGITGSNGKTTVTTLLTQMANDAGIKSAAIGNIGTPALDLVRDPSIELFVLELSSFQLETTHQLRLAAATVLNVSDDHMDRYAGLAEYAVAKQRIYQHAELVVTNRQDELTQVGHRNQQSFGDDTPKHQTEFGIIDGALYQGDQCLIPTCAVAMFGKHNYLNALAAIALGLSVSLPLASMLQTLRQFSGLDHRCARVKSNDGVCWLNDSKATNVGATLAALDGLEQSHGGLILIAGGDAKGGDLTPLAKPFAEKLTHLIVIGRDKQLFCDIYPQAHCKDTLEQAVTLAASLASTGDTVLLSPSCASIDMFENYIARGNAFIEAVGGLHGQ